MIDYYDVLSFFPYPLHLSSSSPFLAPSPPPLLHLSSLQPLLSPPLFLLSLLLSSLQLIAAIIFISLGVIAAFFCAIIDGIIAGEWIVCITPSQPHLHNSTFTTTPSQLHLHNHTFTTTPSQPHLHNHTSTITAQNPTLTIRHLHLGHLTDAKG